jgi:UPF0271 protein
MTLDKLDLNCDLGEGEPLLRTRALLRWITSANVACGGHAGDLTTIVKCVQWAKQFGVRLGAHPGPYSRGDFGRGYVQITPDELELLLLQQVGALERLARSHGVPLHHVKLHGGLYHAVERNELLALYYVTAIHHWWPTARVYARAGGIVASIGRWLGADVWEEAFLDRAYDEDGTLLPRGTPGAVLNRVVDVRQRVRSLMEDCEVITVSGTRLPLRAQTLCVHADTPRAVEWVRLAATMLRLRTAGRRGQSHQK